MIINTHLKQGISLEEFLDDFPSVKKRQAQRLLGIAEEIFESPEVKSIYENITRRESTKTT